MKIMTQKTGGCKTLFMQLKIIKLEGKAESASKC